MMSKEMCAATYRAQQKAGVVLVRATGVHQTAGYEVSFERVGVTIFPPQFSLMHKAPEGSKRKSPTRFSAEVSFEADVKVDTIVVYDARGRHVIDVVQEQESVEDTVTRQQ